MSDRTCFVIMPIGDQEFGGTRISAGELRKRYDDLIKEALLQADSTIKVTRADDIAMPGTITSDILTRLMHSDVVIADVTYPNANVFYEVGLRHACRPGTMLIRDRSGPRIPFDLAHQRCVEYENSPSGLKMLAATFGQYLDFLQRNQGQPDNHFLELAKLTRYAWPDYREAPTERPEAAALKAMLKSPELMDLFMRQGSGETVDQKEIFAALASNPEVAGIFATALATSGEISFGRRAPQAAPQSPAPNRAARRATKGNPKGNRR